MDSEARIKPFIIPSNNKLVFYKRKISSTHLLIKLCQKLKAIIGNQTMGFSKGVIQPLLEVTPTIAPQPPEVTTIKKNDDEASTASSSTRSIETPTFSSKLREVKRGEYSLYAAKSLSSIAVWSYSDHETFKAMVAAIVGCNAQSLEIQVKNQPLLVEVSISLKHL